MSIDASLAILNGTPMSTAGGRPKLATGRGAADGGTRLLQHDAPLDVVAQLAHVARPVVPRHLRQHLRSEQPLLIRDAERRQEHAHQDEQIVEALAQRRHVNGHHREAEVQVLPEATAVDLALQVAIRGADDAHVDLAGSRLTDAADLAGLDGSQQLGLQLERQLADLVEEDRPAVGGLEGAHAVAVGPREAAAQVTEQLGLDEVGADRAAVDHHERPCRRAGFAARSRWRRAPCPCRSRPR